MVLLHRLHIGEANNRFKHTNNDLLDTALKFAIVKLGSLIPHNFSENRKPQQELLYRRYDAEDRAFSRLQRNL